MQNVRSQPPTTSICQVKEWMKRIVGLQATLGRLVEIPIGYQNSTPHKATPKIGRALLVDQACTPKEGTLHRLHFFNWKSSTTRSWYRNRPFQPKLSISVQLESKSFLNKWYCLTNPLGVWRQSILYFPKKFKSKGKASSNWVYF